MIFLLLICIAFQNGRANLVLTIEANKNNTCTAQCSTNTLDGTAQNKKAMNLVHCSKTSAPDNTTQLLQCIEELINVVDKLEKSISINSIVIVSSSCQEIKEKQPNSATGVYLIAKPNGETKYVYCHMEELCGTEGGWTRLAYLNMSDSTKNCPSGFRLYESGGVRACGRPTSSSGSCQSIKFPSNRISYSQVCGRIIGYQYASTSAVSGQNSDINSYYVDGVSITHGFPRQHIWTLMAGLLGSSNANNGVYNCPCSHGSTQTVQSFIGQDYFCESGATNTWDFVTLYAQDPLWDGKGCGSLEGKCCSSSAPGPGLPWFHKILNTTTTDYIELRVCSDQETSDEDVPVGFYEIYVK